MSDFDFSDILGRSLDEIEAPKTVPTGTWDLEVISAKIKKNTRESGPVAEFQAVCRLVSAGDDVNEADLMEFGESGMETTRGFFRIPIWERRDEWAIKRFITQTLKVEDDEVVLAEDMGGALKGSRFTAYAKHRMNENDVDHPFVDWVDPQPV